MPPTFGTDKTRERRGAKEGGMEARRGLGAEGFLGLLSVLIFGGMFFIIILIKLYYIEKANKINDLPTWEDEK